MQLLILIVRGTTGTYTLASRVLIDPQEIEIRSGNPPLPIPERFSKPHTLADLESSVGDIFFDITFVPRRLYLPLIFGYC